MPGCRTRSCLPPLRREAGRHPAREAGRGCCSHCPAEPAVLPPSFDVVRVEGGGSIVIAGKATPAANVELLVGSRVIGKAAAGADGDFAVVLEEPLKPGNYQIVLRSTAPDGVVAMSIETAVVSIPETKDGQVLALVEEPGKPSEMITVPKPEAPSKGAQAPVTPPAAAAPAAESKPGEQVEAALPPKPAPVEAPAAPAAAGPHVVVEAVEIDGRKIFVAGGADAGRTVRGYANDILLGDATASPDGRYLIEAERDLPVGDYIIRIDALEPDGVKVAARAAVPFEREPGETIAAVAPLASGVPAPPAQAPATETPPAAGVAPATPPATAPDAVAEAPTAPAASGTEPGKAPAAEAPAMAEAPAIATPPAIAEAPVAPGTQAAKGEAPALETPPAVAAPKAPAAETPGGRDACGRESACHCRNALRRSRSSCCRGSCGDGHSAGYGSARDRDRRYRRAAAGRRSGSGFAKTPERRQRRHHPARRYAVAHFASRLWTRRALFDHLPCESGPDRGSGPDLAWPGVQGSREVEQTARLTPISAALAIG